MGKYQKSMTTSTAQIRTSNDKRDIRSHLPKENLIEQTQLDDNASGRRLLSIPRSVAIAELGNRGLAERIGRLNIVARAKSQQQAVG